MADSEEYLDVLDEFGNKTGKKKLRSAVHRDGDWHRCVLLWIINDKNEILLQRRAHDKIWAPGLLDISVSGHLHSGDGAISGAIREAKEEINLSLTPGDLALIGERVGCDKILNDTYIDRCFFSTFIARTNKTLSDFTMQESEVIDLLYVSFNEFKRRVATHDPDLVPHPYEYSLLIQLMEQEKEKND